MEKEISYQDYLDEIRLHPLYAYIISMILGQACLILAPLKPFSISSSVLFNLSLFFFLIPLLAGLISYWKPVGGLWIFIISLIVAIIYINDHHDFPGFINLLILPVILALIFIDPKSSLISGIFVSAYLLSDLFWVFSYQSKLMIFMTLLLVWFVLALFLRIYWSNYQFYKWTTEYSISARNSILEARKNNEKYEQMMIDLSFANNLLVHANERADKLRVVAEEAKSAKAKFVANVSHEFRTPLNMIIGLVELMVEAPHIYKMRMTEVLENDLNIVLRNCHHLSEMINDVLDLTRLESGKISLRKEQVNLVEIMEEATQVIQPLIKKKNLKLSVSYPQTPPVIYCDKTRIRQVILNLMSNAARYTDHGSIHGEITCNERQVSVQVIDTGPGISEKELTTIFEPFMQGSADPWKSHEGSGLGLSISKQFVELHGGQMNVRSERGNGSSFMFTLPLNSEIDLGVTPIARIVPDWIWHENQFKSALVSSDDKKYKPCIITNDREGYLAPVLEGIKAGIEFKPVNEMNAITGAVDNNLTEAVLFIAPRIEDLLQSFDQLKQRVRQVPLFGISYSPTGNRLLTSDMKYLIKPITLNVLTKALDELDQSLSSILIVDDDQEFLQLLQNFLHIYNPQMSVIQAANGHEALESLAREKPDAIILDIVMDMMDGWKLLDIKKQDPELDKIPVIILSAQDPYDWPQSVPYMITTLSGGIPLIKCVEWLLLLPSMLESPQ